MTQIEVFYQVEGIRQIQHLTASPGELLAALKVRIVGAHGLGADILLFLEDTEDPVDETCAVDVIAAPHGVKVHAHRCRRVAVTVAFAGRKAEHAFGPGTTIAHVKRWVVERLGMSKEDATEHVLQIAGTHDRPTPSTHLGALVHCPQCHLALDLVADERVQG